MSDRRSLPKQTSQTSRIDAVALELARLLGAQAARMDSNRENAGEQHGKEKDSGGR
jgi:hypothetical protein